MHPSFCLSICLVYHLSLYSFPSLSAPSIGDPFSHLSLFYLSAVVFSACKWCFVYVVLWLMGLDDLNRVWHFGIFRECWRIQRWSSQICFQGIIHCKSRILVQILWLPFGYGIRLDTNRWLGFIDKKEMQAPTWNLKNSRWLPYSRWPPLSTLAQYFLILFES